MSRPRALVVDDSRTTRRVIRRILESDGIEVVGEATDPFEARDLIVSESPDVITLDVEMPRMDGITFLRKLMVHHPLPVVVLSSLTATNGPRYLDALAAGAVDVVGKPGPSESLSTLNETLGERVRVAARARVRPLGSAVRVKSSTNSPPVHRKLIAIGASTGGTVAIEQLLLQIPVGLAPIVIVQHMPAGFTAPFADRLASVTGHQVREATDGEILKQSSVLLAPGDVHLMVEAPGGQYRARLRDGPKVAFNRPAVDVLFRSVAEAASNRAVGVILTGMGEDGARGLAAMKENGAVTVAQDESTCVIFGMPKAAIDQGAADMVCPLDSMGEAIARSLKRRAL